ncbi:MAG: two-component system response regulator CreB [Verrucomicrobiota bacterium]|jgi:two-component system catabolic regulation response regulator CreB
MNPTSSLRPRILIVEDEPSIADNILYSMESEGFESTVCNTGREALAKLRAEDFSLVVLDVGLPDMTGFEVCRQLRTCRGVPVIFLTARNSEVDRVVGLEIGGDDYVCKPFSPRELTARVRAVLRRSAPAMKDPVESSEADKPDQPTPLCVDELRCQISYFGEVLPLSRYEYRLLKIMSRHPGRVFSRSQLMEHASDEPDASMERTVDAHVKSLRAKMKTLKEEIEPIMTHRGLGYSLTEKW